MIGRQQRTDLDAIKKEATLQQTLLHRGVRLVAIDTADGSAGDGWQIRITAGGRAVDLWISAADAGRHLDEIEVMHLEPARQQLGVGMPALRSLFERWLDDRFLL